MKSNLNFLILIASIWALTFALMLSIVSYEYPEDQKMNLEIYTSENIYRIDINKMEVIPDGSDSVFRFNDFRAMKDFLSERSAAEASEIAKYWRCMDTAYANNEYRGCDTKF